MFPVTYPYIVGLYTESGEEIMIIDDYRKLREESRKTLEEALKYLDHVFKIYRIKNIDIRGEYIKMKIETDCGVTEVETYGRGGIVELMNKLIVIDINGVIYEVDRDKLDEKSLKMVKELL